MAKTIRVYTTSTCPYCTMTKTFLKEKNISFQEIDVGRDRKAAKEMVTKSGQMGVPVIEIDGKIIVGFDKEVITRELGD